MTSVIAIISKKLFERDHRDAKVGDVLPLSTYLSHHRALEGLAGGTLFLVTIRPPDHQLWLVAEIAGMKKTATGWSGRKNTLAIVNITKLTDSIKFESGKGITVAPNRLAMSLQTPRRLCADDLALLRSTPKSSPKRKSKAESKPTKPTKPTTKAKPTKPTGPAKAKPAPPTSATLGADHRLLLENILSSRMGQAIPELQQLTTKATVETVDTMFDLKWFDLEKWRSTEALLFWVYSYFLALRFGDLTHAKRLRVVPKRDVYSAAHELVDKMRADVAMLIERRASGAHKGPPPAAKIPTTKAKLVDYLVARIGDSSWDQVEQLVSFVSKPRFSLESPEGFYVYAALLLHGSRDGLKKLATESGSPLLATTRAAHGLGVKSDAIGEKLLAEIYRAPEEIGPIAVYMDYLLERNDPRGSYIRSQLQGEEEPLEELTAVSWAGSLGRVIRWRAPFANEQPCHRLRFRRGFLSGCRVDGLTDEFRNAPESSMIEVLDIEKPIKSLDGFDLRSLRALGGLNASDLAVVVNSSLRDQLVAVGISADAEEVFDQLAKLPNLRWLSISKVPQALAKHPLFERLDELIINLDSVPPKVGRSKVNISAKAWLYTSICLPSYDQIGALSFADKPVRKPVPPLLAAVYENPQDLETIEAYAASLKEQDDVRAEFIALQCERSRNGGRRSKREADLFKAHHREWLGRLDRVALASGLEFENGFVSALRYKTDPFAKDVGADEWRTVRSLVLPDDVDAQTLLIHPVLEELETLECSIYNFAEILGGKTKHKWKTLKLSASYMSSVVSRVLDAKLPNLTELEIGKRLTPDDLSQLLKSAVGKRLHRLRFPVRDDIAKKERLASASPKMRTLELEIFQAQRDKRANWRLTFSRPPKSKQFTKLELRHLTGKPPNTTRLLVDQLESLSGKGLKAVALVGTKSVVTNATVRKHVRTALTRLPFAELVEQ